MGTAALLSQTCLTTLKADPAQLSICSIADDVQSSSVKRLRSERYLPPHKFVNRGASEKPGAQDYVVPSSATRTLKAYDKRLRQFQFREALDAAVATADGQIVAVLLEELACRNALKAGLGAFSLFPIRL